MASLIVAQLLFLESENPEKPIYMYINSPGGVITAGMAIYDTMQVRRPPLWLSPLAARGALTRAHVASLRRPPRSTCRRRCTRSASARRRRWARSC